MTKNKESTRYASNKQEQSVCKIINGTQQPNSGASKFRKGDVCNRAASLLCECKTVMQDKDSFSIKKDWIKKNKDESFTQRLSNQCIAFSFGPDQENYFVINEKLMRYLVEKLEEEYA
jgi:hypothetical protein